MKQKITVVIDSEIARLAKRRAAKERRSLSELLSFADYSDPLAGEFHREMIVTTRHNIAQTSIIRKALPSYLRRNVASAEERKMACQLFCEQPMKISPGQLRYVLEEDVSEL